jgi:hypothetical protein
MRYPNMSHWESQIRTNLEDPIYSDLLDRAIASTSGILAAGLVNVRYGEGCLREPSAEQASESELAQLIALTEWLFAPNTAREASSDRAAALARLEQIESAFWTTRTERLFAQRVGERVLVLSVSSARNLGSALALVKEAVALAKVNDAPEFEQMRDVLAAGMLDPSVQSFANTYERHGDRSEFAFDGLMARVLSQFFDRAAPSVPAVFTRRSDGERLHVLTTQFTTATRFRSWSALTFDPEHLLFVIADRQVAHQGLVFSLLNRATDDTVRVWADGLLSFGIDPIIEPFPKTQHEFLAIVEELRALHENDLIGRLRVGGFTNYSMGEGEEIQRCQECIYYHPNRKWCDLPELPIPVDAHWWCRLWNVSA